MLITNSSYHTDGGSLHPQSTMLRFNNVVDDVKKSKMVVFVGYQFNPTEEINRLVDSFKNYKDKVIVLDFSCEIFSGELYNRMLLEESLENIVVYTNGIPPDIQTLNPLIKKGCNVITLPFFLKYIHYYSPLWVLPDDQEIVKRKFLLYVGKLKPERTALVGLLSYYDLLNDNHVVYLTGENNFSPETTEDYFDNYAPAEQKVLVRSGLNKIYSDLILDVEQLTHHISHGREYNSDYYQSVDFVIVCESDTTRGIQFITEKIGKCVQLNKKFILLGSTGLLSYVKEQSKIHLNRDISTLTDWCDTSYDEIDDVWERVDKIVEIVKNEVEQ